KKIYPYVSETVTLQDPVVTADDDVYYPKHWLRNLDHAYRQMPEFIHCYWARFVAMSGNQLLSYAQWPHSATSAPSLRHFAIGVSGVIYPPEFLRVLKAAGEKFMECCPTADDVWHHVLAVRSGHQVRQIERRPRTFLGIPGSQKVGLYRNNIKGGGNDD